MTAELKAMLDELMGKDRDMSLDQKASRGEHWSDDHVCKSFLVRFCPHDLFTNTRADLGPCKGTNHDVKFREIYRASSKYKKVGYENAFIRTLENVVDDMERKIRRQHERLEHDEQYMRKEQEKADEFRNSRLDVLNKDIDELLEKMADAGAKGNVEEAQEMMKGVEGMRQEREAIKSAQTDDNRKKIFLVKPNVPFINEMKHMEVCNICGAFLVVNDTQTRVDAHLTGKQHMGYDLIRRTIKELKDERDQDFKAVAEPTPGPCKVEEEKVEEPEKEKEPSRNASREKSGRLSKERESFRKEDRYDKDGNVRIRGEKSRDRERDRRRDDRNDRHRDRRGRDGNNRRRSRSRDRSSRDRSSRSSRENKERINGEEEKKEDKLEGGADAAPESSEKSGEAEAEKPEEKKEEKKGEREKSRDRRSGERRRSRDRTSRSRDRRRSRSRSHGRKRSRY